MTHHADSAVIAASCASDAVTELLRYAREGNATERHAFGEAEPIAKLVEALVRAAELERAGYEGRPAFATEAEQLDQLIFDLRTFHWEWMGLELAEAADGPR